MALALSRGPRVVLGCDLYEAWSRRMAAAGRPVLSWQELPDEVRAAWQGLSTDLSAGRIHA